MTRGLTINSNCPPTLAHRGAGRPSPRLPLTLGHQPGLPARTGRTSVLGCCQKDKQRGQRARGRGGLPFSLPSRRPATHPAGPWGPDRGLGACAGTGLPPALQEHPAQRWRPAWLRRGRSRSSRGHRPQRSPLGGRRPVTTRGAVGGARGAGGGRACAVRPRGRGDRGPAPWRLTPHPVPRRAGRAESLQRTPSPQEGESAQ